MKLQGIIFDLDGTLGNTLPVVFEAFQRTLLEFLGQHYTDREIRALFGPTEEGIFQQLVPDRWQDCLQTYLAAYEEVHARYAQPFPGIEDALQLLERRGVSLAIVTAKGRHSAAISLRYLGLAHYFDAVETGTAAGAVKPVFIQKVLAKWGAPPCQVAYVGDAAYDVEAAREAGVIPLGAAWAATADADCLSALSPLATFRSVEGFIEWIEANVEPPGPLMRKMDCIRLYVPDIEAGLSYYRDRLGHELVWRTENQVGLRMPDSDAEIVLHTDRQEPEIDMLVDSADAAATRVEAAGGRIVVPPFDIQIGRCVVVQDPWGNQLVLLDTSKGLLVTDGEGHVIGVEPSCAGHGPARSVE